jgi:hypothetical protein
MMTGYGSEDGCEVLLKDKFPCLILYFGTFYLFMLRLMTWIENVASFSTAAP